MDKSNSDLAFKLWDIANAVVGICIVQAMSFIYKCADKDFSNKLRMNETISNVTISISVIGFVIYIMIIWGCQRSSEKLLPDNKTFDSIWFIATRVRTGIVILFTLISFMVFFLVKNSPVVY